MTDQIDLETIKPDRVFNGGDMDCGSGLVLILREHMAQVPKGGVLEMQSREPTVGDDLPPWCRMVGHTYLGALQGEGFTRYFIKSETSPEDEIKVLIEDKEKARQYAWRLRARSAEHLRSTAYCRNFSIDIGQAASFDERDKYPSAVEYFLAALAGDLSTGFATECAKRNLEVDDIEISVKGRLNNILAHLGIDEGDPSFASIELKCFISTFEDEANIREAWNYTFERSPLARTIQKAVDFQQKLTIV